MAVVILFLLLSLLPFGCVSLSAGRPEPESDRLFRLAQDQFELRNPYRAIALIDRGLQLEPEDIDAVFLKGEIYFNLREYDRANILFNRVISVDPGFYAAVRMRWAVRLDRVDNAPTERRAVRVEIDSFIKHHSHDPVALYNAYQALVYIKADEDAGRMIPGILKLDRKKQFLNELSDGYQSYANKAVGAVREGRLLEYLRLFPVTIKKRARVYRSLISIYRHQPDGVGIEKMVHIGYRWLRENPNNRWANHTVAINFIRVKVRLNEAVSMLDRALRLIQRPDRFLKPEYQDIAGWQKGLAKSRALYYAYRGYAQFLMGRHKRASVSFKKSDRDGVRVAALYEFQGLMYESENRLKEAYGSYKTAMILGPGSESVVPERLDALFALVNAGSGANETVNEIEAARAGVVYFKDVTAVAGLDEIKGVRVAWGDFNRDGYEDLLVNGDTLLLNKGDGRFENISGKVGLKPDWRHVGGVWADFNNDGYPDFYQMGRHGGGHRFFRNVAGEKFEDAGPDGSNDKYVNQGAAWGDIDGDGLVDLYVANYEKPDNMSIGVSFCQPDFLWKNIGTAEKTGFINIAGDAGTATPLAMCGRGVAMADYNNDGAIDIHLSNYRLDPNYLWENTMNNTVKNTVNNKLHDGGVRFVDHSAEQGVKGYFNIGAYGHTIGSVWGDIDNDGDLDLFSANLAHPHLRGLSDRSMLLRNDGDRFTDIIEDAGISFNETDADPSFADIDNDGDLDLFVTSVYPNRFSHLYLNDGSGRFQDVSWLSGLRVENGWGSGFADYDNDGDLDLAVSSNGSIRLFENQGNGNNWIQVDPTSAPGSGIGARVTVNAAGTTQIREVEGGKGTGNQNSLPVEFGLGEYGGVVDVFIKYSSGKEVELKSVLTNRKLVVNQGLKP